MEGEFPASQIHTTDKSGTYSVFLKIAKKTGLGKSSKNSSETVLWILKPQRFSQVSLQPKSSWAAPVVSDSDLLSEEGCC